MATLIGQELYDHLDHLGREIEKRRSESNSQSLQYLIHSQLKNIIESEKKYLKHVNSNGTKPILSILLNGLPSLESLKPDLEAMCELAEQETDFKDLAEEYKRGIKRKTITGSDSVNYEKISEEEWKKRLAVYNQKDLVSKIGFAVRNTEDDKFELEFKEDFFLKGHDKYSKEFPVLTRKGKVRYHVTWNRLLEDYEEEGFYAVDMNTKKVISRGKALVVSTEREEKEVENNPVFFPTFSRLIRKSAKKLTSIEKVKLTVNHNGKDLIFAYPFCGPGTYMEVAKEVEKRGLSKPTMAEVASLIHGAFDSKDKYSKEIKGLVRDNLFVTSTGVLYVPKKGVYIQDHPEMKYGIPIMEEKELIKKLEANNPSIRFVSYGYKIKEMNALELEKNKFTIALAGEEGAAKLAEVAASYKETPCLFCFESVDQYHVEFSGVSSKQNQGGRILQVSSSINPLYGRSFFLPIQKNTLRRME